MEVSARNIVLGGGEGGEGGCWRENLRTVGGGGGGEGTVGGEMGEMGINVEREKERESWRTGRSGL